MKKQSKKNWWVKSTNSTTLNNFEHSIILAATITGCTSISDIASLVGISRGVASSAIGLKTCAIAN